jgi:hypothetical protein
MNRVLGRSCHVPGDVVVVRIVAIGAIPVVGLS